MLCRTDAYSGVQVLAARTVGERNEGRRTSPARPQVPVPSSPSSDDLGRSEVPAARGFWARFLLSALVAVGALATCLVAAETAGAYGHGWSCNAASGSQCYDDAYTRGGQQYNAWRSVIASMSATSAQVCAKGITAAGNIKIGSGCNNGTTNRTSCLNSDPPESWAYVYWAGTGTIRLINGAAQTSATSVPPC